MPKIKFFARFKEEIGKEVIEISADNISLEELLEKLSKDYPKIREFVEEGLVAVNHEVVNNLKIKIKDTDEIAILPFFSGG